MGLDGVEIVMAWEESLNMTISDGDAERMLTTREVVDCLAQKVSAVTGAAGACLFQRAFHRVRCAFMEACASPRSRIRLETKILDLAPRRSWPAVQQAAGIPKLSPPGWLFFSSPQTVRDLVQWVVANAAWRLKPPGELWTHAQIRTVVRAVITAQLGLTNFSDEAEFVRDLKID